MKSIVLSLFFAGMSLATLANGPHDPIGDKSESTAEVKFIGSNAGGYSFNVLYNNTAGARFSVAILDEFGDQLYQHFYTDRKFDKNFRLPDPESYGKLVFVIRNLSDNSVQRFEVHADSRVVDEVKVKEVE
ncbi:hypothetical protein [Puia sp.]|jgi:hypothetical protein|uniref:hypothetical protein n=1 Tax=Puia sp. TaxID=2045100 RepID=UPI002F3F74FA